MSTRLIGLILVTLSAGCASVKGTEAGPASLQAIAANQRESIAVMREVLAEQIRHNKAFEAALFSNKDLPKKDDRKPPGKKG
jgi:hypothetical protein